MNTLSLVGLLHPGGNEHGTRGQRKEAPVVSVLGTHPQRLLELLLLLFFLISVHSLYIFLACLLFQFLRAASSASNYVFNPRPSHDSQRCHTGSSRQVKTSFRHFITLLLELFVTVRKKPLLGDFTLKTDFVERDLQLSKHASLSNSLSLQVGKYFSPATFKAHPSANQCPDCFQLRQAA